LFQLATLLAGLTVSQNPTINPETGTVNDVQTRIQPPVVTPRPSPDVQSPSTTASPGINPPRPTESLTNSTAPGRTPLRRPGDVTPTPPTPGTTTGAPQTGPQTPLPADTRTPNEV
jgi:hypothetical protein